MSSRSRAEALEQESSKEDMVDTIWWTHAMAATLHLVGAVRLGTWVPTDYLSI